MKSIVSYLIMILPLFMSCNQKSILYQYYEKDEIYAIKINEYGFPTVEIQLNNNSEWITWDTGNMAGICLSNRLAKNFNIPKSDTIFYRTAGGEPAGIGFRFQIDSMEIFNEMRYNSELFTKDLSMNGLIGPKFVELSRFSIDYKNKLIGISKNNFSTNYKGTRFEMISSNKYPKLIVIEASLNGQKFLLELDTGKSRTVVDTDLVKSLSLKQGEGGVIIDDLKFEDIILDISNAKVGNFKGTSKGFPVPIKLGIGSDILKNYIFTTDYSQGTVILTPN